jgi:4-amino-4-deoxy-L-arabinose transferase-like glycosyltransferase
MRALPSLLKLPPTGYTLAGLLAFYVLAGLFGHDPWKTEDVIHLAVARDFLDPSHGPGLSLAGQPFLAAPLYYWSAALTGYLFGGFMPLHDALRFSSGLWTALTLTAAYYAGRALYGQENAAATPLLLAGSFGLIVRAHEAQPMLILLAALCFLLLAFCLLPRKPRSAAALLSVALVAAGLGMGLAGTILLLALLLPAFLAYRNCRVLLPLGIALLASAILLAIAGGWLGEIAPQWFHAWLNRELGLFSGAFHYFSRLWEMLGMLPWFSWPLLPLAGWSLWLRRRQWSSPEIALPFLAFALLLLLLPLVFPAEEAPAMLLLPPLALLATPGALALRRGAANAFDWFAGMAFSVFAILLWIGWSAMVFGWPERLARRAVELAPGFVGRFDLFFFLLALIVTSWWIWNLAALPRSPYRCLTRWTTGLMTVWLLAVSLWLPWIDYGKSYRGLAAALASQMRGNQGDCVAEWRLGSAQRASFAYFERLRFTPLDANRQTRCRWLLAQGGSRSELTPPGQGWQRIWEGQRPGDRKERFRLYRRSP